MTKREKELARRADNRKLRFFPESSSLLFGFGASLIVGFALILFSYDLKIRQFNMVTVYAGSVFVVEGLLCLLAQHLVKKSVIATGKVSRAIRLFGIILILFVANANVFAALGGLALIKEKKNTEYLLGRYMILEEVLVIIVSCINMFKEYVVHSFYTGIGLMAAVVLSSGSTLMPPLTSTTSHLSSPARPVMA